jgi:hypothetical protein
MEEKKISRRDCEEEKRRACGLERRKSNSQNQNLERERAMDNEEIWAKIF